MIPPEVDTIIERTLKHEGYLSDDPQDSGGKTKYGISQAAHPEVDLTTLTRQGAKDIYYQEYYLPFAEFPAGIQPQLFDIAVNSGPGTAKSLLEKALKLKAPSNFTLLNSSRAVLPVVLNKRLVEERLIFYAKIMIRKPSQFKFARGWFRRALSYYV